MMDTKTEIAETLREVATAAEERCGLLLPGDRRVHAQLLRA